MIFYWALLLKICISYFLCTYAAEKNAPYSNVNITSFALEKNTKETVESLVKKMAAIDTSIYDLSMHRSQKLKPIIPAQRFSSIIQSTLKLYIEEIQTVGWINNESLPEKYFIVETDWKNQICFEGATYAQKLIVPQGSRIITHGDIHGDGKSLSIFIEHLKNTEIIDNHFKLKNPHDYMVFLGDYVDRGPYGSEVLYMLFLLKLANPNQCILIRGNHESLSMNLDKKNGFIKELCNKYKFDSENILTSGLLQLYHLMPTVLYLRSDSTSEAHTFEWCQLNHGGIEMLYDPTDLFKAPASRTHHVINLGNEKLEREKKYADFKDFLEAKNVTLSITEETMLKEDVYMKKLCDFLWGDFIVNFDKKSNNNPYLKMGDGKRIAYGKNTVELFHEYLNKKAEGQHTICGIIRAHQHADDAMMKMIVQGPRKGSAWLWEDAKRSSNKLSKNIVVTLCVCCNTVYGNVNEEDDPITFESHAIIYPEKKFTDWTMKIFTKDMHELDAQYKCSNID